ncbi:hypothetical protein ACCUM_1123 [Candidatus Accumulibacter phosphatis]|uniref:Uncharacterized protein n=1 Tax=Candidatus Accumulibacter phosphatis TaxID=327160 RepID=A0A5S4FCH7_9PROT|nr:hypothetical protein ACCUM_1123 [Candidatus Accumulibacter phosphatis]
MEVADAIQESSLPPLAGATAEMSGDAWKGHAPLEHASLYF